MSGALMNKVWDLFGMDSAEPEEYDDENVYDYEDEEDEQTSEFSYEGGHTLEYSCKYEKNIKKKVELLLKY